MELDANAPLSILYRGPLSSCNYDCHYCPFAKTHNTAAELRHDRNCLTRFVDWSKSTEFPLRILFTPWGEALVRRWYQTAMVQLSHLPLVQRVAIQTNLSCKLDWLADADLSALALWCTFHPSQTELGAFINQCQQLDDLRVRHSVGVVGLKEDFDRIASLRSALRSTTYLWINAFKRVPGYYSASDIEFLQSIDPLFSINNTRHPSEHRSCHAGHQSISVDGNGDVRRCHFIDQVIGNIYETDFVQCLRPRLCSNETCGCYIGYVNLEHLQLDRVYGDGLLERIPM